MTSRIPDSAWRFLALVPAVALLAVPAWAQKAEDGTETAPETAEEEPKPADRTAPDPGAEGENGVAADGKTAPKGEPDGEDETAEDESDGGPLIVEAEEGSVIDDQTFEGEDDDFTPSEEIPVDQPIPFPVDI